MTIRQRRVYIKELAKSIVVFSDDVRNYCGEKQPFALSEEEYGWWQKVRDYAVMLADIDVTEKPD